MTLKTNFVLLLILSSVSLIAQPTIYKQLCNLNKEWNIIEPTAELLEKRQFTSEEEIITYHLQQVEKHLTKKNIAHLPLAVQQNREEGLAVLRAYFNRRLYPKNNDFNFRIPFFIDDANTACAVGYIMQGTGYETLANNISETQNNAYVKEMVTDNIIDWATNYGFTVDELAWIQPTYGPCMSSSVYVQNTVKPTCGNNNGAIQINDQDIVSYEWKHGANSLQLDNLPAGFYTITGTYADNTYWGNGENCPFELDIFLENENSADLAFNTISNQSCEEVEDGTKEVIVINANGSYNIEWSNGETTAIASNLTYGFQFVIVTDEMNCKAIGQTYVSINSPIRSNEVVSGTICNSNTGNTSLNIEGGSGNGIYSVLWMDGNKLENRTNMNAGNYTVLISDAAGCFIEKSIIINDDCNGKINCEDDYIDVNNQYDTYMFQFANDIDPFDGTITSIDITQPMHGSVSAYNYLYAGKKLNENNLYIYYEGDETYIGSDSFTYTVCTDAGFCDNATVYLNVVSQPVVSIYNTSADNLQMYLGETLQLRLRGAETFSVSPTTGLDLGSLEWSNVWANPTETTTYTITGTNLDGQTDTHNITIEVVKAGFEAFNNAIQIHQDADNNMVYINGQLEMVDVSVLDANNNVIMNMPTQNNTIIISSNGFTDGLHYLNIQHKNYPNVRTKTILKQ